MNWIVAKKNLSENIVKLEIKALEIALSRKPGHHVIIKIDKDSEPFPMVISRVNITNGTITLFVHKIGVIHQKLAAHVVGDELFEVSGPYGYSIKIDKVGTVLCAAGGVGIAPLFPVIEALKEAGNRVITVLAARSCNKLILEDEIRRISDELIILTDDGSCGKKGLVTDGMLEVFNREKVDQVVTFGSARMIKHSTLLTRMYNIPLVATLYSMKVENIGINGIYRVSVCGNSKYICVDGIDFNAFYPDFDTMINRMESRLSKESVGNQNYSLHQLL
jgi:ferredoxin/flavodoxin---NADP+ reductase